MNGYGLDYHKPVLLKEVVEYLVYTADGLYVDGTAGTGGHSLAIGQALTGKGSLICLDRDPDAVGLSKERLTVLGDRTKVIQASYADLDKVLEELKIKKVDGVLLDLGMSSFQLDFSGRGFSFNKNEPLDMRMDPESGVPAGYLINKLSGDELKMILRKYGEERKAGLIVKAILRAREKKPVTTSSELAALIKSVIHQPYRVKARHPATRTFQALRIAVNKELQNIDMFLGKIPFLLSNGGRLVVISYHSLEDRKIKQAMFKWENSCTCPPDFPYCVCGKKPLFRRILKKGLKPGMEEIEENPRARSAILRVAERIQP